MQTSAHETVPVTIRMGGCAGLHHYMFGIGAYIQEHYVLGTDLCLQSVSGSNYVMASMLSNHSVESIWRLWSHRLDDIVTHRPWTCYFHMFSVAEQNTREVIQATVGLDQMKQHQVRVCLLDRMQTVWVNDHTDAEDYLSAILAGSFLPGICGYLWRRYRHHRCIDGGMRLRCTPVADTTKTISISVFEGKTLSRYRWRLWWMALVGLWSCRAHHQVQYAHGYAHARDILRPQLDALLVRRACRLRLQSVAGHIRWDPVERVFIPIDGGLASQEIANLNKK
jgi:hypothetical protein